MRERNIAPYNNTCMPLLISSGISNDIGVVRLLLPLEKPPLITPPLTPPLAAGVDVGCDKHQLWFLRSSSPATTRQEVNCMHTALQYQHSYIY